MRKHFFLFVILSTGFFTTAYTQIIYTKQGNTHNNFFDVYEEPITQNLIISCVNATVIPTSNYENNKSCFLKTTSGGTQIDSISISGNFSINGKMLVHNNFYYIYGVEHSSADINNRWLYPTLIKYDSNFHEIKKTKLDSQYVGFVSTIQSTCIINNQLYTTFFYGNNPKARIFKLSLNLDIKDTLTYYASTVTSMIKQGNNLLVSGGGFPNQSPLGRSQAMLMDTNFNVINRFNFDSVAINSITNCTEELGIFPQDCNLVEISNNSYYAAGFFPASYTSGCTAFDDQAVYAVVKNNSLVIKGGFYGTSGGAREMNANFTAGADRQGKYIYNTCVSNWTNNNFFGNYTPTSILTAKIDTSGNLIWQKYFDSPGYFYHPSGIYATADSGIVIVGRRYNTVNPQIINALEGFVLKLDKNGNQVFTGINDKEITNANTFNLFPNPTINEAYIHFPHLENELEINIKVIDMLGKLLYQTTKTINDGTEKITLDTKLFANGLYNVIISSSQGSVTKKLSVIK
jgi:hypothetical protein